MADGNREDRPEEDQVRGIADEEDDFESSEDFDEEDDEESGEEGTL